MRRIKCEILRKNSSLDGFRLPVIIKPRFGSGSRDVIAIFHESEYGQALKNIDLSKEDFLIEGLVIGTEYGLSGVVLDGIYHHILIRQKVLTPFPYRQCVANISTPEIPEVTKYMQKSIKRFKFKKQPNKC